MTEQSSPDQGSASGGESVGTGMKLPSDRTVRFLLVILRAALQHAVREDELPRNVARNVELSKGTKREIEPLTAKEGRQLLAAARDNRLWAAYELAVRIGLRRGELLGLRWSDVDLHEGVLTVRQPYSGSVANC
ncbi:tyrosine-type recombinase/integrase [Streptomyces massasporeus]|uniref:tyrosine-type recombinase/integrase n=1 Tax=Streptomyces massasporeus TaxID=67324 RepID=UPI0033D7F7BD